MSARDQVEHILEEFHAAAAAADEERYLATLTPSFVFLGTAPGERWEGQRFRDFVHSYFSRGKGWTYLPSGRSVVLTEDETTAWFDETLENGFYGRCRGSGVLRLVGGEWRLEQYNLTIPVPDELAPELVAKIREVRPA